MIQRAPRRSFSINDRACSNPWFSRIATNSISGVIIPRRAYAICVTALPPRPRSALRRDQPWNTAFASGGKRSPQSCSSTSPRPRIQSDRSIGNPDSTVPEYPDSPHAPLVSYTRSGAFASIPPPGTWLAESEISRMGTLKSGWIRPGTYTRRDLASSARASIVSFVAIMQSPVITSFLKRNDEESTGSLRQHYLDQVQRVQPRSRTVVSASGQCQRTGLVSSPQRN